MSNNSSNKENVVSQTKAMAGFFSLNSNQEKRDKIIKKLKEVKRFFERDNMLKQMKAMAGYLIPGRKIDVRLNIGGGSYTDNKKIVVGLPEILLNRSKEEMLMALLALVGHESQHVVSSNFEAFIKFQKQVAEYLNKKHNLPIGVGMKVAHALGNSVEDGRIEKILCIKYPGYLSKIQFLNLLFWEEQPIEGTSEFGDFMYCIISYSVTGLNPKGYDDIYANTELDEQLSKIKPLIIRGINARTCEQALGICMEIIHEIEDYLVKIIKAQMEHDKQMFDQMQEMPDFNNSEESETNDQGGSGSSSTHFTPEEMGEKPKSKKKQQKSSGSGDNKDKEDNEEGDSSEEDDKSSGNSTEDGSEGEEDEQNNGSGNSNEDSSEEEEDLTDEENSSSKGSGEDEETGEESSREDNQDNSGEGSDGSSSVEDSGQDSSQGDSKKGSDSNGDNDSDSQSGDDDSDQEPEGEGADNSSKKAERETPKPMDENKIKEILNELKEGLAEEAENTIKDIERKEKSDQAKRDKEATLTEKEYEDLREQYKGDIYTTFREVKTDRPTNQLPVQLKKDATNFRREVEKIFKNKEVFNLKNQPKGVLNGNDLWKVPTGDYNVFAKKGTPSQSDYVAYVLQDGSGSMQEANKQYYSAFACATIEEGFKGIIPLKITTFCTDREVLHYQVKGFNENEKTKNYSYDFLNSRTASGGNKDGYSIRVATKELLRRNEKDKILFILSDGLPSDYAGRIKQGMEDVKQAVKEARKQGIIVVSIVFGSEKFREDSMDLYKYMYEKNIISCNPDAISKNLTKTLKKIISR